MLTSYYYYYLSAGIIIHDTTAVHVLLSGRANRDTNWLCGRSRRVTLIRTGSKRSRTRSCRIDGWSNECWWSWLSSDHRWTHHRSWRCWHVVSRRRFVVRLIVCRVASKGRLGHSSTTGSRRRSSHSLTLR